MKLKASLHLHSQEDTEDGVIINYTLYELIDWLANLGFQVLGSACHLKNICQAEHIKYAAQKGILLISGVEINFDGHKHLLILNGGLDADKVKTVDQLRDFKRCHPEAFIIAPHPHHFKSSIGLKRLKQLTGLVDAVEHSWFYSTLFNPNSRTRRLSKKIKLPFIATCDAHVLDYLNIDYAVIEADALTSVAVFEAICAGRFENFTQPKSLFELIRFILFLARGKARLFLNDKDKK